MATIKVPTQSGVRQLNINDTFGELWSTRNIDLRTDPNKTKLARPMKKVATSAEISNSDVEAFGILGSKAYALTDVELFEASSPFTSWSSSTTDPSNETDMVVFDGQLVIAGTSSDIDAYDGSIYTDDWWGAAGGPNLTTTGPGTTRVLEVVRIGEETLAVTDGSIVRGYTGAISGGGTFVAVDLDSVFVASCIKTSIRRVWIGTYTEDADQAFVFEWDGASANYTQAFPVGAKAVLSMEIVDNVPVIVTERGEVKKFNGSGFTTISQFPFATKPLFVEGVETGQIQGINTARPIHPKGMRRQQNTLYIATSFVGVNTTLPVDERTPSGLWAMDLSTNSLSHLTSQDNESVMVASSPVMIINEVNGRIFLGGQKNDDTNGIWLEDLDDSTEHCGYFVTVEIQSDTVKDMYDEFISKALLDTNDSVVVKYRTENVIGYPLTSQSGTWLTPNQFNTTDDLSLVKSRFDADEKDELEVLVGSGVPNVAQITNVEMSGSTYSVTIDADIGTANESADVRFDNWSLIPSTFDSDDGEVKRMGSNAPGSWVQYKVVFSGKAGLPEMREFIVKTNSKQEV